MLKTWKRRTAGERGSVLVITAVMLVPVLGFAAFAVDMGNYYQARRQAQAAADAGALAGVQDLPSSASTATTDANTYANKNLTSGAMSGASVTPTTPYNSNSNEIQVTVSKSVPTIFGKILGVSSETVSASAVAENSGSSSSGGSIFAYDDNCSNEGVVLNGSDDTIGGITGNGSIFGNASNSTYGATTYGGPSKCSFTPNGSGNTWGGKSAPTQTSTLNSWPETYTLPTSAQCSAGSMNGLPLFCQTNGFTWNSGSCPANGIYYAEGSNGNITIGGNNCTADVTFIYGGNFNDNGTGENFTPEYSNLLVWNTGTNTIDINGNGYVNNGAVYSPSAPIVWNASSGNVKGFLEGLDVTITATDLNFTGIGPTSSGTSSTGYLVQ